jgi:CheY-like chemotaxis protein
MNLNDAVRSMAGLYRSLLGESVSVVTRLQPDLRPVEVDPAQIEQVLMNLVINAKDAMPEGGNVTIETQNVELDSEYARAHVSVSPGAYVMLSVSDTGHGMTKEVQEQIFEPFFTTKPHGKGTGLGLSTVYGIVKQSGGNIWVYSEPGRGTTFKVYFPQVHEAAVTRPAEETVERLEPAGGGETLLLVEDEAAVRQLVFRVLAGHGYTVLVADSGDEALRLLESRGEPIALLLTDVILPGMSGRELADRLRGRLPGLKVLYMSGYTQNAIVHDGRLDAGVAFLEKPFTPEDLVRRVREVLGSG